MMHAIRMRVPHFPSGRHIIEFMRTIRLWAVALMLAIVGNVAQPVLAQTPTGEQALREAQAEVARLQQELAAMRDQYDARLKALEEKLAALVAAGVPAAPAAPITQEPAPPLPLPPTAHWW